MKGLRWLLVSVGILICSPAWSQDVERIEADKVKEYGTILTRETGKLTDLPVKVVPDLNKAVGIHGDNRGALVVPDAKLSAEVLKKAGSDIVPVGVLYLYRVTPISAEQALTGDKNRTIEVTGEDGNRMTINVLHLAAGKIANRLVLLVYAKGKEPAIVTELVETSDNRPDPIDLQGQKVGETRAAGILLLAGRYRAALQVTGQE